MILGIETSGELGSVACLREGESCGELEFSTRQEACRRLPVAAGELLAAHTLALTALSGIAVSRGPGSFNGLRVGLAFAKALAHALRRPIVGVPTPLAWAQESAARFPEAALAVLQPVRREFLYLTVFAPGDPPAYLAPTALTADSDWLDQAAALAEDRPLALTGDWPGLRELPPLPAGWQVDAERRLTPSAATTARLALPELPTTPLESCFTLRPEYLSPSQAERMRGVDLGL
jgi:tRNA threonylcarbamoyladenosine biosynthesis protein TsaB